MAGSSRLSPRVRGSTRQIEAAARRLRADMTPAEQRLWAMLRNRRLDGLAFRCQHPVGRFILDFYSPACRLAVELDGGVHEAQADSDEARTAVLQAHGYRVLRFRNEEVLDDLPSVLRRIAAAAREPLATGHRHD